MICFVRYFLILMLVVGSVNCVKQRSVKLPPVVDGWRKPSALKNGYIVQRGDTLYSIAWAFGIDYHDLAIINNISSPYLLHRGRRLYIFPSSKKAKAKISHKKRSVTRTKVLAGWVWPTSGKVIAKFSNRLGGNRGIDIAGSFNQAVLASNDGEVVYSGTGIRSYGKLIIIKHNSAYLSAYAYNKKMLVTEGDKVKKGKKIAVMGRDNRGRTNLHFEIRRFGKPVNPLLYLPKKQ